MGIGKSKTDPCHLSVPWGKSQSVDTSQSPQTSDSKQSEDISLHGDAVCSSTAEMPAGEQEGVEESPEEDTEEEVFLKFVILHAEEDTAEALRVQSLLENDFGIKPGIIFAIILSCVCIH